MFVTDTALLSQMSVIKRQAANMEKQNRLKERYINTYLEDLYCVLLNKLTKKLRGYIESTHVFVDGKPNQLARYIVFESFNKEKLKFEQREVVVENFSKRGDIENVKRFIFLINQQLSGLTEVTFLYLKGKDSARFSLR